MRVDFSFSYALSAKTITGLILFSLQPSFYNYICSFRRIYTVASALHELEFLGHFTSGNIFIAPPDASDSVSDEDSGDEHQKLVTTTTTGRMWQQHLKEARDETLATLTMKTKTRVMMIFP